MMDEYIITSDNTSKCLLKSVRDYAGFVSQVLHDETFLMALSKTLPFDRMVHATKKFSANNFGVKKMGISVMRMDIDPPLYSLAITIMFRGVDGIMQNHSIFINAGKTIEELQQLVVEESFIKEVLALCEERVFGGQSVLTDN